MYLFLTGGSLLHLEEAVIVPFGDFGFVHSLLIMNSTHQQITVGILLGFILIQPQDLPDIQTHLALLLSEFEFSMPTLDFSRVEAEWRRLRERIPEPWKLNTNGLEFTVGEAIAARGLSAKYPVVLVPGIISTVGPVSSHSASIVFRIYFLGFRIVVNITRISNFLSAEGLGRVFYDLAGDFQSGEMDVFNDAGPHNWTGPAWCQGSSC